METGSPLDPVWVENAAHGATIPCVAAIAAAQGLEPRDRAEVWVFERAALDFLCAVA